MQYAYFLLIVNKHHTYTIKMFWKLCIILAVNKIKSYLYEQISDFLISIEFYSKTERKY